MSRVKQFIAGSTVKSTYVNTGAVPTQITSALLTGSEACVSSGAMTSSVTIAGHYYRFMTLPTSPGYYVAETRAWVNSYEFIRRVPLQAVRGEVD